MKGKQTGLNDQTGESVKVALRVRPLNSMQLGRGDQLCLNVVGPNSINVDLKTQTKQFTFDFAIPIEASQAEVFKNCSIHQFIEAAFQGYSATIFAYGQTGSGKTYTMAGQQDNLSTNLHSGQSQGIIPRAVRYIWQVMSQKKMQYFIKSSFLEIYNQQVRDLLNPASGNLNCRWNSENGFFVQDLIVVDCVNTQDMAAVLHQGIKNRKIGSHQLNKDSSRSHSVMTVYVVSSVKAGDQTLNKYGKISFVDLAGSQRLKQSKSQGGLVKETGNINRSLFTLGKVINGLADKSKSYIPYRDSKLTMLLMDSLGGTSKALMIACVSPSSSYLQQTINTMSYAARTMNIKNKPVLQMDSKDQMLLSLVKQRDLLLLQNQYLRQQISKSGGRPKDLKPLQSLTRTPSNKPLLSSKQKFEQKEPSGRQLQVQVPFTKLIQEYEYQIQRLQKQVKELGNAREINERNQYIVKNDNNALVMRLDNLQQIFINQKEGVPVAQEYMNRNLVLQNSDLKHRISEAQSANLQIQAAMLQTVTTDPQIIKKRSQLSKLKTQHSDLLNKINYLQSRQRELMQVLSSKMK